MGSRQISSFFVSFCKVVTDTYVGHGDNDDVLLVVELAGSKVKLQTEEVPFLVGHDQVPAAADGIGNQLDDVRRDGDARVAKREEHVDARADGTEDEADDPGADGVGMDVDIIVSNNGSHL